MGGHESSSRMSLPHLFATTDMIAMVIAAGDRCGDAGRQRGSPPRRMSALC